MRTTLLVSLVLLLCAGCSKKEAAPPLEPITAPWSDDFGRDAVGTDYRDTARNAYLLSNGALNAKGAHNKPLWLRRPLPRNVRVELETWSQSPEGDIKVELFGDGKSYDPDKGAYLSTGYVFIMGGWGNSKSMIARLDEHGKELITRPGPRVVRGKRYKWTIERRGNQIDWFVDDTTAPFLSYQDSKPLEGPTHSFFGFNNWESDIWFDNLTVTPL